MTTLSLSVLGFCFLVYTNTSKQIQSRIHRANLPNIIGLLENSHEVFEKDIPLITTGTLEFLIAINTIENRELFLASELEPSEKTYLYLCKKEFIVLTTIDYFTTCPNTYKRNIIWENEPFKLMQFLAQ